MRIGRWVAIGLLLSGAISGCGSSGSPATTVTVTETVTADAGSVSSDDSSDGSSDDGSDDALQPDLDPADFKIDVKIREKQCFGDAGCNITYRIDPTYTGAADISSGSWDVTYEVTGGESGAQTGTFTLTNGQASVNSEDTIQTSSSKKKLKAKATSVDKS